MVTTTSTGFVGFLVKEGTDTHKVITTIHKNLQDEYKDDFKPQRFPHTTMIYLGKMYIEDTESFVKDEYFTERISKFKNSICTFDRLDFIGKCLVIVYKFENPFLSSLLVDLTNKYERNYHAQFLHITVGSLTVDSKRKFTETKSDAKTTKSVIEEMLKNFTFKIDQPIIVKVDADKSYHVYAPVCL
jgi:hypothetical protein